MQTLNLTLFSAKTGSYYVCLAKTKKDEQFGTGPSSIVVIVPDYKNSIHYI